MEINEMIRFRTKHKTSVSQRNRGFVETLIMRGPTSNFRRGKYDLLWRTAPLTQGIIESNKGSKQDDCQLRLSKSPEKPL